MFFISQAIFNLHASRTFFLLLHVLHTLDQGKQGAVIHNHLTRLKKFSILILIKLILFITRNQVNANAMFDLSS